jgi:hypothetical protein
VIKPLIPVAGGGTSELGKHRRITTLTADKGNDNPSE